MQHFKKIILFFFLLQLFTPLAVFGQEKAATRPTGDDVFEAEVIKVLEQKEVIRENGGKAIQQNLLLYGLKGKWAGKEVNFNGLSEMDVVNSDVYKVGDKVMVERVVDQAGAEKFYVTDFVRRGYLYLLAAIFAVVVAVVGRRKGLRALLGLAVSFFIILKFILPAILAGYNPLVTGLLGAFAILVMMIYLTEGWNRKSHLAVASVFFSLLATLLLSALFTALTRLTGLAQEEATFLTLDAVGRAIDFRGLLLTGILIGTVGVLDDVVMGQIEAVEQIREANPELSTLQTFKMAYKIGNAHLGAIVNTLFLTYTGASLPLLLLFAVKQEPPLLFGQVINNEIVATEMVRTLVGSIGVALSLPVATYLAAKWLKRRKI